MRANFVVLRNYSNDYFDLDYQNPKNVKSEYAKVWKNRIKDLKFYLDWCEKLMLTDTPDDSNYDNYDMFELLETKSSWQGVFNDLTLMLTDDCRKSHHDWKDIQDNLSYMFNDYDDPRCF